MVFVKTFKGYEDKVREVDTHVNDWLKSNENGITRVVDIKVALSHEQGSRAGSGDLVYVVIYEAAEPLG